MINHLDDKMMLPKFYGRCFAEVLFYAPDYFKWILETVDGSICAFSDVVIHEIEILFPDFIITKEMRWLIQLRQEEYENAIIKHQHRRERRYSHLTIGEKPTYDRYNGSYAQDEMGYSDDDIDTIFDGDSDAYWNID